MSEKQQVQVKVTDDRLEGRYANMAQVAHGPEEFVLDFMNVYPPTGIIVARLVVSPGHAKRLARVLAENLEKYEKRFGTISDISDNLIANLFYGNKDE